MGKRGPKPKPTALRVFEGDPGRLLGKLDGEITPQSRPECPAAPEWLGDIGKQVWGYVAPNLHAIGCLTLNDEKLLSLYCEAWDELFQSRKEIENEGLTLMSPKGTTYAHPAVGIKSRAIQRIRIIGGEFGMSPAARVGLKIGGGGEKLSALQSFKKHG